ncbi:general stress protein [Peribacillus saganii]|uniref:General stress protein n=1 Tax=Peribacillus saganii TaxID=2303992 RepID=A0A372LLU6_9BACI|nr:general stress protein [Peribacillus saganii]RFU67451.1 general stress protein [Peribacillus saganii]
MEKRVIGVFENNEQAKTAVEDLQRKGYKLEDISIIAKNIDGLGSAADQVESKETDGVIAGAAVGGAVGLAGFLVGMSALAIPGLGPILAAGPIFTTISGAVAGLTTNEGLRKALQQQGLNETEARQYEEDVKKGRILIFVS